MKVSWSRSKNNLKRLKLKSYFRRNVFLTIYKKITIPFNYLNKLVGPYKGSGGGGGGYKTCWGFRYHIEEVTNDKNKIRDTVRFKKPKLIGAIWIGFPRTKGKGKPRNIKFRIINKY